MTRMDKPRLLAAFGRSAMMIGGAGFGGGLVALAFQAVEGNIDGAISNFPLVAFLFLILSIGIWAHATGLEKMEASA